MTTDRQLAILASELVMDLRFIPPEEWTNGAAEELILTKLRQTIATEQQRPSSFATVGSEPRTEYRCSTCRRTATPAELGSTCSLSPQDDTNCAGRIQQVFD
jgi:DNA-directed RNA polymerase subunit RPC12/RpoP